jgi:outer membrane receptor for ferrienterochelin and colicins
VVKEQILPYLKKVWMFAKYALGAEREYELYGGVNNIFDESVDKLVGSNVGPYFFAGVRVTF